VGRVHPNRPRRLGNCSVFARHPHDLGSSAVF
jgi:hypothetical protein